VAKQPSSLGTIIKLKNPWNDQPENASQHKVTRAATRHVVAAPAPHDNPAQTRVALPPAFKKSAKREMRTVQHDSGLPHENPCAQCGKPIAAPVWTENGPRRISYLWHCRACDYEFEAVAFYDASHPSQEALAAYAAAA
jgi:ribosomal protein L37AE/L43A